jgi:hypothetical protein
VLICPAHISINAISGLVTGLVTISVQPVLETDTSRRRKIAAGTGDLILFLLWMPDNEFC